jgi:hypothetical protein
VVPRAHHAFHLGAAGTAEDVLVGFDAVPDDPAPAMRALRGHRVDRTLKAVEHVAFIALHNFKGIVVIVAAGFASGHGKFSRWILPIARNISHWRAALFAPEPDLRLAIYNWNLGQRTARQPMRCLSCKYDLSNLTEHGCSECGRAFDPNNPASYGPARQPYMTNKRRLLLGGVIVCLIPVGGSLINYLGGVDFGRFDWEAGRWFLIPAILLSIPLIVSFLTTFRYNKRWPLTSFVKRHNAVKHIVLSAAANPLCVAAIRLLSTASVLALSEIPLWASEIELWRAANLLSAGGDVLATVAKGLPPREGRRSSREGVQPCHEKGQSRRE